MLEQNKNEFDKLGITYWRDKGYTGKGVNIVVLDVSGAPLEKHHIIQPLAVAGQDAKLNHKTHVSAIIREILPEANIYAFYWSANYKDKILDWIREHQDIIDVINCSFEGNVGADDFAKLKEFDIPVMGAMGNSSKPYGNSTSAFDFVTGIIAWVEYNDKKASYSNYGLHADFACYTNIYYETDKNLDYMFGGTSCAAPVAASLVGLYSEHFRKTNNRPMTRQECFEFMLLNVDDKEDIGRDDISGHGLFRLPNEIPILKKEVIEEGEEVVVILRKGSIGENVKSLQTKLNGLDIDAGVVDGIFGTKTDLAVKELQSIFGLSVDGIVGKNTYTLFNKLEYVKHFTLNEFRCRHCKKLKLNIELLLKLEELRIALGDKAIIVNSGYRCPIYNATVGGIKNSEHLKGNAADIYVIGVTPSEVHRVADIVFANGGVGKYNSFTHVDVGINRYRWDNSN